MRVPALLTLFALLSAAPASADELTVSVSASARKNVVTFNPLALVFGAVNLEYERAVTDAVSVFVGPGIVAFDVYGLDDDTSLFAAGLNAGARIFLSGTAPRGLWLSPSVGAAYVNVEGANDAEATVVGLDASLLFGHTWIWKNGFALSLGIGAGYHDLSADVGGDRIGMRGPTVNGRLGIGYAF